MQPPPAASDPGACKAFAPRGLTIGVAPILKLQGYTDLSRVRPAIKSTAESVAAMASRMAAPEARYRRIGIDRGGDGALILADGTRFRCAAFDRYLAGCREVVVFVLTLGGGFDRIEGNLSADGRLLETVFLETAGWIAIEQATKRLAEHLRRAVEPEGLALTRRLAPGYSFDLGGRACEWPLLDQIALFGLFRDVVLPVQVLESGGMVPKMSRSGLYGLRPRQ